MEIKQVIRANAQIVRITDLQKGNVIKCIEENSYGGPTLSYGVVTDIMFDGNKAFVELVLYKKSYSNVDLESRLLTGDEEKITLFPATKQDLMDHFDQVKTSMLQDIKKDEKELEEKRQVFARLEQLLSTDGQALSEPAFETEQAQLQH